MTKRMRAETIVRPNTGTHINLEVQDRDVYGSFAVGELETSFRSVVTVALEGVDGWLIATALDRDAFDALDVEFLEEAARMIAPSLSSVELAA
ncbi:MAG TPA: hypothetical protein QGI71_08250 [Dehalococcoidia bacterium]|jgi:hypothetical protein|nr:hypothetical protein [Dehalococcoidia bacterium]